MSFLSFCASVKEKFISFKNKLFKSKKVGDGNKFNSGNNGNRDSETRTERLLLIILSRLEDIEQNLNKLIDEKNKEIKDSFEYTTTNNKRYKVM